MDKWRQNYWFSPKTRILDDKGNIQYTEEGGLSGVLPPEWSDVPGGTSQDNAITWILIYDTM